MEEKMEKELGDLITTIIEEMKNDYESGSDVDEKDLKTVERLFKLYTMERSKNLDVDVQKHKERMDLSNASENSKFKNEELKLKMDQAKFENDFKSKELDFKKDQVGTDNELKLKEIEIRQGQIEIDNDFKNKDFELKEKEFELEKDKLKLIVKEQESKENSNKKSEKWKLLTDISDITLPLIVKSFWVKQGFEFEKTGTITSNFFRAMIPDCIKFKRK